MNGKELQGGIPLGKGDTMRRPVVGVMGGGEVSAEDVAVAYDVGRLVARNDWVLLNGGRNAGVMDSSARGAHDGGGLVIGIIPDDHLGRASTYLDVAIITGMGSARNNINVLSCAVVIACSGGAGTLSEIALALKAERPVIAVNIEVGAAFQSFVDKGLLMSVRDAEEAISLTKELVYKKQPETLTP
jgi:uncharacterized protein (TIGR00725 family)